MNSDDMRLCVLKEVNKVNKRVKILSSAKSNCLQASLSTPYAFPFSIYIRICLFSYTQQTKI